MKAVRFYLFVIFCVAMIFSCWGSFQREVFWLKLTLYYAQVMTMLTTTVMMMLMLLMFMKSDSYRDGDDVEVDDFIWYIFTIRCKTGGGMNASNWIFTHLKFQKKNALPMRRIVFAL